jgi:hypothetical protein
MVEETFLFDRQNMQVLGAENDSLVSYLGVLHIAYLVVVMGRLE